MDGTFKTAPLLFSQLYSIHCEVGGINSRILPIVWALITSKSENCYIASFEELRRLALIEGFVLRLNFVLTDFERAAMNAMTQVFPEAQSKAYHLHLSQIIYRKIESLRLTSQYTVV
jgi:hypothetical protein